MRYFFASVSDLSKAAWRRRAPRPLSVLFATASAAALFCSLCVGASAQGGPGGASNQGTIPDKILLRTGFVGVSYNFDLSSPLPSDAPDIRWVELICSRPGGAEVIANGNVKLVCPRGLRVNNEKTLVVAPVAEDTTQKNPDGSVVRRTAPYVFDVRGTTGSGVEVRIRYELPVRPLGVDDAKFRTLRADERRPESEEEFRRIAVGFTAGRFPTPTPTPTPAVPRPPFVLVKSTADEETLSLTEEFGAFDPTTVIKNDTDSRSNFYIENADVKPLIVGTLGTDPTVAADMNKFFRKGDYLVVHVIRWKELKDDKSDPERELWALFEKIDKRTIDGREYEWLPRFAASEKGTITQKRIYDTRIYGSKRVFVLPVHLNTPQTWDIKYKLLVKQQVPTPIQNALALATTLAGGAPPGADDTQSETKNIWGARLMLVQYAASDMIVNANAVTPTADFQIKEQNKDYSKKYDNEGRYWWDVSVGLPANSIKELSYTVDNSGLNSVVSVKKVERQNAYGFLNIFPVPVDLEAKSFLTKPHLVLGVPISGKPLDRPIVALGTGVYGDFFKINFFAGVAFNKVREPRTLKVGDAANEGQLETDIRTRREPKFVFGINFPVRQFLDAIKGSNK